MSPFETLTIAVLIASNLASLGVIFYQRRTIRAQRSLIRRRWSQHNA